MPNVRSAMGAYDETRLYEEVERVTADACAAFEDGNAIGLGPLLARREAFVDLIRRTGTPPDAATIERILHLDGRLLERLKSEQARIALTLAHMSTSRQALASYRGTAPRSATYYESMG